MENSIEKLHSLQEALTEYRNSEIFNYLKFYETGKLTEILNACGISYDDIDFIYRGSRCIEIQIMLDFEDSPAGIFSVIRQEDEFDRFVVIRSMSSFSNRRAV